MRINGRSLFCVIALGATLGFAACSGGGDTDGGAATDQVTDTFPDEVFVSGDDSTGTISVEVNDTELAIGEVSGFSVTVRDANGNGVPNIQIACDSENGLAIVEPTTGYELTGPDGHMSGKIGCELPGSLTFVCRLPIGTNRRDFVHMKCTGDVPLGFAGFEGAAGGGLGGGVAVGDNNNTDGSVRLTQISYSDTGDSSQTTTSIDTVQGSCSSGATPTAEPFYDTSVTLTVQNDSQQSVRFTKMSYSVENADGAGGQFNSKDIGLVAEVDGNGGTGTVSALVFDATNGSKGFVSASGTQVIGFTGFRSVTFRLFGENSLGEQVILTGRAAASFGNFNRCTS